MLTAGCLINKTPTQILDGKTPYEISFGKHPQFNLIKVFGCLCFSHRQSRDKDKFGERSRKYNFVGHPFGKKGWRLYHLENKEYFVSRDVKFFKTIFPFQQDNEIKDGHDFGGTSSPNNYHFGEVDLHNGVGNDEENFQRAHMNAHGVENRGSDVTQRK